MILPPAQQELNSLDFLLKESAVTHKGGQMKFYVDKNAPYNNSIFHYWKTPRQELVVDTIAFKDALELGYQYKRPVNVKMNIEGAEIEILENWSPDYDVDKIAFQWHFHIDNKLDRLRAVIEKLVSMGYDVVTAKDLPLDRDTWWDGRWDYIWVHCIRAGNLKLNENVKRNLVAVQRSIVGQEKSSVMARWEFGRMVAEQLSNTLSSGRKVRRDILIVKQILEETGISKSEMDHRLRLFLKYPNEDEVSAAIIQFPSWSAMIIDGLYEKRKITQNAHISLKRFSYEECSRKLQWLYENKRESLFLSEKITDILKLMFEEEREIVFDESQGFYLK